MNRLVVSIILGVGVVALAWYAVDTHNEQLNAMQLDLGKARLRTQFEERAAGIHGESNTERRVDELTALTKWYHTEFAALCNQFPGKCDPDAYVKEAEAASAAGQKVDDLQLRKEFAGETKGLYETILKGRYKPLATADLEGVRIDVLGIRRVQDEGKSRLRMDVVVWNAPLQMVEHGDGPTRNAAAMKRQLNFSFGGLNFEFINEDDKLVGGAETGGPRFLIDAPDRLYSEFPPQGAIAAWYLDPLPTEADHMTVKLTAEVKSPTNGSLPINTEWALKVDPEWRVKDGEKFDGEQRLMPEEELDRKPHAEK